MIRVFVDANTVVSGLLFEGNESHLLDMAFLSLIEVVTIDYVMREVRGALGRKEFGLSESEVSRLILVALGWIRLLADPLEEELRKSWNVLNDEKNHPVLVRFQESGYDVLVTGDKELLEKVPRSMRTKNFLRFLRKKLSG
ncbi:MAG: hypothetical protein ACE5QW_07050 [Thermoplasmata archaeon]